MYIRSKFCIKNASVRSAIIQITDFRNNVDDFCKYLFLFFILFYPVPHFIILCLLQVLAGCLAIISWTDARIPLNADFPLYRPNNHHIQDTYVSIALCPDPRQIIIHLIILRPIQNMRIITRLKIFTPVIRSIKLKFGMVMW